MDIRYILNISIFFMFFQTCSTLYAAENPLIALFSFNDQLKKIENLTALFSPITDIPTAWRAFNILEKSLIPNDEISITDIERFTPLQIVQLVPQINTILGYLRTNAGMKTTLNRTIPRLTTWKDALKKNITQYVEHALPLVGAWASAEEVHEKGASAQAYTFKNYKSIKTQRVEAFLYLLFNTIETDVLHEALMPILSELTYSDTVQKQLLSLDPSPPLISELEPKALKKYLSGLYFTALKKHINAKYSQA